MRKAFTLLELLVVIGIIAVLAALILPAINVLHARSLTTNCSHLMRQLGNAALLYAAEHEMSLPVTSHQRSTGGRSWAITVQEYAGGTIAFRCPCDGHPTRAYTYVLNDFLTPNPAGAPDIDYSRLSRLERPGETVLFAEASEGYLNSDHFHFSEFRGRILSPAVFSQQVAVERHGGSANYVFADGHAETLPWPDTRQKLGTQGSRFVDPTAQPLP